jgi:hypothetical protein
VLDVNFDAVPDAEYGGGQWLVQGSFSTYTVPDFGEFADLTLERAWTSATDAAASGTVYQAASTGIECFAWPCPSFEATAIGSTRTTTLEGVNLNDVGASDEALTAALAALGTGDLLVAGTLSSTRIHNQRWYTLNATQFYLPVKTVEVGECTVEDPASCTLSTYTEPVTSSRDCYCPMCPMPMASDEAEANRLGWMEYCGEDFGLTCPIPMCIAPPGELACIEGQCGYTGSLE